MMSKIQQIFIVFHHEWQQKRRSGLLNLLFICMQVLLVVAVVTAWSQYQHTLTQQQTAQQLVEQQWQQQPDRHPHRVAHFGHFTFRPPNALSFFDNGVNLFVGNSIYIEAHKQNSALFANFQDSDVLLRISELSVANILLVFWPLLLIALAYNSITAERASGTLRQLLSLNISVPSLLLGKGLTYLFISVLFIAPIFIITMALLTYSDLALNYDILMRIFILFWIYISYCLIWIALILLVSSIVKYEPHALNILIATWFVLTIISPRVLADIAAETYPKLSRNSFNQQIKQEISLVGDSHDPEDPHFNEFKTQTLARYGVKTVDLLPVNYKALLMQEGERISSEIFTRLYHQQIQQQRKQQQMIRAMYWLNPYLLIRDMSMALTAADVWHFYDYEQQTEAHRFARIKQINKIHAEQVDHEHDKKPRVSANNWQDFAQFKYQAPSLTQSMAPFSIVWIIPLLFFVLASVLLLNAKVQRRLYAQA
ncbi:MAG: DUF3526 domain-containing protein [Paraglaciecola sp.]|nr:DUF3526 domain-containing protein [Paraglaciecola sp.]